MWFSCSFANFQCLLILRITCSFMLSVELVHLSFLLCGWRTLDEPPQIGRNFFFFFKYWRGLFLEPEFWRPFAASKPQVLIMQCSSTHFHCFNFKILCQTPFRSQRRISFSSSRMIKHNKMYMLSPMKHLMILGRTLLPIPFFF